MIASTDRVPARRRLRDRLVDRGGTENPRLARHELKNLLLFVDDDLRETALALGGIESFLSDALRLLEKADLRSQDVEGLLGGDVAERLDILGESLESLRRRMGLLASSLP